MHEYAIVEQLVKDVTARLQSEKGGRVKAVQVRRGSTFAEAPLRQAFQMLTADTPLQGAELIVTEFAVRATCGGCGHSQEITADDLIGHLFVCPSCGTSEEIDEAHGLELTSVTIERPETCCVKVE
ncbi:MAG TPA: hydrogenase maturation nickel metallochaperone HypA [Acidobacteriota bacterium]|nr:hydrogenase maturation nickel metallochaperone HypA [Acidobacteriota bacterium]